MVGAPWVKVLSALDCQRAKERGSKVFYRPYDIPNHDDGGTGDGTGMANAVLARLGSIPSNRWPDAVGFRNEFGGGDTTTPAQFINYYDRLRSGGYTGMIVFGSYSTGVPESYRWSQSDVKNAVNKADAIETHEYFDRTEAFCHTWLCCRHVRFINENPYLQGKPWFIGEAGSDEIFGGCHEDPCNRKGWRDDRGCGQKLTEAQYINELTIYRNACASQVVAIFIFQQGDQYNWGQFEVLGTSVATWMQSTWNANPTGAIAGNVRNSSGQNLVGATVTTSPGGYSAATDTGGNYTINIIPAGTYSVTASKSGYVSQTLTRTVNASQTTTANFVLGVVPPGTLSGLVTNRSGQGIQGATVSLAPGGASATTGPSGSYAMSGVPVGDYTATATKAGYLDASSPVTIQSGQTTTADFALCGATTELLTNGSFTSGCTGWSRSQTGGYWGCGNKAYPGTSPGSGGHSWNAYLYCGGYFCDKSFTGEQHQDNVAVVPGACYQASAQVYYEPVLHAGDPSDQKERIVLTFSNGATHASAWHTHTAGNGWDRILLTDVVPAGATRVSFRVELSHTDGQWSGTAAVDECSLLSQQVRSVATIREAKSWPDGECISLAGRVVSARFGDCFYIEDSSRLAGIKVTGATAAEGTPVTVTGILATINGERAITGAVVE